MKYKFEAAFLEFYFWMGEPGAIAFFMLKVSPAESNDQLGTQF